MPKPACRAAAACLLALISGCTAFEREQVSQTERVLAQAGFKAIRADNDEQRRVLAALPPHRLARQAEDGKTLYAYADAEGCGCEYVGDADAYRMFGVLEEREALIRSWAAPDL